MKKPRILLIYAGGTIGMAQNKETGALSTLAFDHLHRHIPELHQLNIELQCYETVNPMDSASAGPAQWVELSQIITEHYSQVDGFVVLHGTDTMAYAGSVMSFLLENLAKPVIFTGSLLPVGMIRTDGKENILTALQMATLGDQLPEVCIYFENQLFRANRTVKYSAESFDSFKSPNYGCLAEAGVKIDYHNDLILPLPEKDFKGHTEVGKGVVAIKIFPGMSASVFEVLLEQQESEVIVVETYGTGNAPTEDWFIRPLKRAIDSGKIVLNVSQCARGFVDQSLYETGQAMLDIGVMSGKDMTFEAAVTKAMCLKGRIEDKTLLSIMLSTNLRGELKQ